jgi:hypothetical protein
LIGIRAFLAFRENWSRPRLADSMLRTRPAAAFTHHGNAFPLASLVGELSPVPTMFFARSGLYVAAEVGPIDLNRASEPFGVLESAKSFAELVREDERRLMLHIQISR